MNLYIYDKNDVLQAVLSNDADACPFWDAVHDEKLTGENTFTFSTVADKEESEFIVEGNSVAFQDKDGYWQLFEIKKTTDTHNSDGITREVYAEHAYYELIDSIVTDIRPYNVSAAFALQRALENTRWSVGTVADLGINSTNFYYETALSAVQKVANTWGGELRYRIAINNNQITARYVDLPARRGEVTGKRFEFTKDIKEVKRDIDISNICTAAYGRGKGEEIETAEGGTAYGRRTTFADVVWSIANGDPVDKPAGQEWVGDTDALAQWGRGGQHRFAIYQDDEETDPDVLLEKTWQYVQEHKVPLITYTMDVLDLERLAGYEHEAVRLGDSVNVRDIDLGIDVVARIIEIGRDLLLPENTKIVLGNFLPNLANLSIAQNRINQMVSDRSGVWDRATAFNPDGTLSTEWLEGVIDTLVTEVKAGAGTVTITDDNGILITDNATNPTKALRLLGGIFAIANSKTPEGDWNWRTFGTGDGFTADQINAGQIQTSLVKIFGSTQFYWDGDNIYVINPSDSNQQIRIGKYDGMNYGIAFTTDGGTSWRNVMNFNGLYIGANTAQFASGYDPSTKETPDGAQAKVDTHNALASPHNLPSYTKLTNTGIQIFDGSNNKRAHFGQYQTGEYGAWVDSGYYVLKDKGLEMSLQQMPNLIPEHGFETVPVTGSVDATYKDYAIGDMRWNNWSKQGSPRLICMRLTHLLDMAALYGTNSLVSNSGNWLEVTVKCQPLTTYTLSGFAAGGYRSTAGIPKLFAEFYLPTWESISTTSKTFTAVSGQFNWNRYSFTFTTPDEAAYVRIVPYAASTAWVYWDGIQLVEGSRPVRYEPESELWNHATRYIPAHMVDKDTNTNGSYVKFGDGTMICWVRMSVTDQAINRAYGSLFIGTRNWTFPAKFLNPPTVTCSEFKWGTGASWGGVSAATYSYAVLRGYDVLSRASGTTCTIAATAIGVW
jgi:phage minor structural protein